MRSNESLSLYTSFATGELSYSLLSVSATELTADDLVEYSLDGRTLNQAFVECSSVEAAKTIVRQRDGSRLRGRPVHVTMSSQGELLSTVSFDTPRDFDLL